MAEFELKRRGVPYRVEGTTRLDAERRLEHALQSNPGMEDNARAAFVSEPGTLNRFVIGMGKQVDQTQKGIRQTYAELTGDRAEANRIAEQIANDNRAFADLDEGFGAEDIGQIAVEAAKIGIGGPVSQAVRAGVSAFASPEEEESTGDIRDRASRAALSAAVPIGLRGAGAFKNMVTGSMARIHNLGTVAKAAYKKNVANGTSNISGPGVMQFLTSQFGRSATKPLVSGKLGDQLVNKAVVASLMGTGQEFLLDQASREDQQTNNPR